MQDCGEIMGSRETFLLWKDSNCRAHPNPLPRLSNLPKEDQFPDPASFRADSPGRGWQNPEVSPEHVQGVWGEETQEKVLTAPACS